MIAMRNRIIDDSSGYDFDRLVPLHKVKDILGIGYSRITELVREGELPAHNVGGRPVSREDVTESTRGLRIPESALRDYIERIRIS